MWGSQVEFIVAFDDLTNEGYINGYEIVNDDLNKRQIKLSLKYDKDGQPLIESIRRVSKPSKRIFTKKKDIIWLA